MVEVELEMKRLYANIVLTALLVAVVEACLIWVYFHFFKGSANELPFVILLVAILIGVNIPMLRLMPRWLVIFRGKVRFAVDIDAKIPTEMKFPLNLTGMRRGLLVICFRNCSPDCVGRDIKFRAENDGACEVIDECGEPLPLGFGDVKRSAARWSKGMGDAKKPLIYDWPTGGSGCCTGELMVHFNWNFIGTYLERKLPQDRTLVGRIIVFEK